MVSLMRWARGLLVVAMALCVLGAGAVTGADPSASERAARMREYEQYALTHPGDAERGRILFEAAERTKCAVCHKSGALGGEVGPALTTIGGKFDRPHLIESLLEPSRQIVEGYRTSTLMTVDGEVFSGIIKSASETTLQLVDAAGKQFAIDAADVEARAESATSIMPEGLAEALSLAEFADLIRYLETLRAGGEKMGAGVHGPINLPEGFVIETVATGLSGAVAMETTTDGRVFICEQSGSLRVVRDGELLEQPFVSLPVLMDWERGLIGVTVAPEFPDDPHVYLCYVVEFPFPHHVVSRLVADGDVAVPDSEQILIEGDDQRELGGNVPAGHQGGALHFGSDGKLYVAIGEQTAGLPSQHLETFQGKLLRINSDGSIPDDNPFVDQTSGKYAAIWARGLRNPFTFAIDRGTDVMLINDVGGKFEEINRGVAGANYGWPVAEHGPTDDPRFVGPIHIYPQASISGGDFVPLESSWPAEWRGRYLFADFVLGWIHAIDAGADDLESFHTFAAGLRRPVDLRFASDDSLYVLIRNAWVVDDKFLPGTSSLLRISYAGLSPDAAR